MAIIRWSSLLLIILPDRHWKPDSIIERRIGYGFFSFRYLGHRMRPRRVSTGLAHHDSEVRTRGAQDVSQVFVL